jgi:hypothetical protein
MFISSSAASPSNPTIANSKYDYYLLTEGCPIHYDQRDQACSTQYSKDQKEDTMNIEGNENICSQQSIDSVEKRMIRRQETKLKSKMEEEEKQYHLILPVPFNWKQSKPYYCSRTNRLLITPYFHIDEDVNKYLALPTLQRAFTTSAIPIRHHYSNSSSSSMSSQQHNHQIGQSVQRRRTFPMSLASTFGSPGSTAHPSTTLSSQQQQEQQTVSYLGKRDRTQDEVDSSFTHNISRSQTQYQPYNSSSQETSTLLSSTPKPKRRYTGFLPR